MPPALRYSLPTHEGAVTPPPALSNTPAGITPTGTPATIASYGIERTLLPLDIGPARADLEPARDSDGEKLEWSIDGYIWLFLVDDGEDTLVASAEKDGIYVARFDPTDETWDGEPRWWSLILDTEVAAEASWTYYHPNAPTSDKRQSFSRIADHWHVFAHGYHWICCSLTGPNPDSEAAGEDAEESYGMLLIKFTFEDGAVGPTILEKWLVKSPSSRDDYYADLLDTSKYRLINKTRDMFMVARPDQGVAIGVQHIALNPYDPRESDDPLTYVPSDDEGHTIILVDNDGTISEMELYGSADTPGFRHGNGASAHRRFGGWTVLAPVTFSSQYQGGILRVLTNKDWNPVYIDQLTNEPGYNHSKPIHIPLPSWFFVHVLCYKRFAAPSDEDNGSLMLDVLSGPDGILRDTTPGATGFAPREISADAHRPQMLYWNDLILLCWDNGSRVSLRIYSLTLSD